MSFDLPTIPSLPLLPPWPPMHPPLPLPCPQLGPVVNKIVDSESLELFIRRLMEFPPSAVTLTVSLACLAIDNSPSRKPLKKGGACTPSSSSSDHPSTLWALCGKEEAVVFDWVGAGKGGSKEGSSGVGGGGGVSVPCSPRPLPQCPHGAPSLYSRGAPRPPTALRFPFLCPPARLIDGRRREGGEGSTGPSGDRGARVRSGAHPSRDGH